MNMITDLVRKFGAILLIMMLLIPSAAADVVTAEWNRQPQNAVPTDSAISQYGDVAVVSYDNGYVVAIDTAGNTVIWSTDIGSSVTEIVLNPEATYVLAYDSVNKVTLLKVDTGEVVWTHQSSSAVLDIDMSLAHYCMIVTANDIIVKDVAGAVVTNILKDKDNTGATVTFTKAVIDHATGYIVAGMSDNTVRKYTFQDHSGTWLSELSGYMYRREHRIKGSSEGYLENYGVNITVYRTTGTTTGDKVYVGTKCRTDFNDIRFVDKTTGEVLQHAKTGEVTNGMGFTVKVPYLGQNQNYDIYIYYGNAAATTDVSNWNGIVYDDIGWIAPSSIITNPSFETDIGWPETSRYMGPDGYYYFIESTSMSTAWSTNGARSLRMDFSTVYSHAGTGYVTHSEQISGVNGSFGVQVYFDAKNTAGGWGYYSSKGPVSISVTSTVTGSANGGTSISKSFTAHGSSVSDFSESETYNNLNFYAPSGSTVTLRTSASSTAYDRDGDPINDGDKFVIGEFDNLRFKRVIKYPPTHLSWGLEQQYLVKDGYLQDTEPISEPIRLMDLAWDGNKVSVATDTRLYSLTIDANGIASATYVTTSGTPYDLMSGSDNNYVIEGRGLKALIYQSGTTLVGSQTAGNNMKHVALDEITGTWAIGAADDTHVYVFSKSNTSTWAYVWGTTPPDPVRTVAMNARGQNFLYAINSGYIYFYSTTATSVTYPDVFITIHISKNGAPYAGALCDVYYSDTGSGYALENAGMVADSSGKLIVHAITGDYYRIVVKDPDGNIEDSLDIHVGRTTYDYYLSVITYAQPGDTPSFSATYDDTTEQITVRYNDPGLMTTGARIVIAKIDEVTGTKTVVMDRSDFDNPNSIVAVYTVNDLDASYYIEVYGERGANDYYNTRVVTPPDRWRIVDDIPGIYHINALITWIFIGGLAYSGSRRSIGVTLALVIAVTVIAGRLGLIAITAESVSFAIILTAGAYILSRAKGGN